MHPLTTLPQTLQIKSEKYYPVAPQKRMTNISNKFLFSGVSRSFLLWLIILLVIILINLHCPRRSLDLRSFILLDLHLLRRLFPPRSRPITFLARGINVHSRPPRTATDGRLSFHLFRDIRRFSRRTRTNERGSRPGGLIMRFGRWRG